ncbi:MAG TPA: GGDEF domain-containing protein [Xanthomonadales bacterium]|nr:GGDEF domain-containing protein [Xanthomonadales bacterium]
MIAGGFPWLALAGALLVSSTCVAEAACLPEARRAALRAQAESAADDAVAAPAWLHVFEAAVACGDLEGAAAALAARAASARGKGRISLLVARETERARFAATHLLARHEADARSSLGRALIAQGEFDPARRELEIARARYEALGAPLEQAGAHSDLSRLERRRGDYLAALREELVGLELRRRHAPGADVSRSLLSLANLYEQIELFDESRAHYAAALAEAERHGIAVDIADALNGYAGFLNDFGGEDSRQALPMAERALALHRQLGDPARIGSCLLQIGRANMNLGRHPEAEAAYAEAFEVARASGSKALGAHVDFRWGELELARGDAATALSRIEQARREYEREGNRHRLIKVHGALERVHTALGDPLAALRAGREHFRLRNELLGANATGKLGELLTNFALSEERHRNETLEQANAVAALQLESEQRTRRAGYAVALVVLAALALLAWRHLTVQRLYRLLRDKTHETEAQGAALAIANAQLRELSITDALTGLRTRAHGIERFGEMLARHRELGTCPVMLLIDVDHFKAINDRHGHPAGDAVLAAVAQTLAGTVPDDAVLARLGGEEFMVAVPDDGGDRAQVLADALRRRVRDLRVDVGARTLNVTISVGICGVADTGEASVRAIFAGADEALYAAKHAGRDCVRTYRAATA